MLVTEEEAKTKRCQEGFGPPLSNTPMMFAGAAGAAFITSPANCIGSACMAWRWPFSGRDTDRSQNDDRALGYCGKAGRP